MRCASGSTREASVMGVRHVGVVTGTGTFTLAPLDGGRGTRFEWSEDLRFPWWLGGRLGEVIGGKLKNVRGVVAVERAG